MRASWTLGLLLIVSGCISSQPDEPARDPTDCPKADALWLPLGQDTVPLEVDGTLRSDLIAFFPQTPKIRITDVQMPERWKWDVQNIGPTDDNGTLIRFGFTPVATGDAKVGRDPTRGPGLFQPLIVNWTTGQTDGCPEAGSSNVWRPMYIASDKTVQPGDGVAVFYAGFWLNGTLFSTNIATVDESSWPRGGWYASGDNKPLNVYVYDKQASERADYWSPKDPVTEKPVKWSYGPTIEGFNSALKGLSVGSSRVVVVPPEKAYTRPDREGHHLYGDTLVFFIDVVEIVDVPCAPEIPNRSICRTPAV